MNEDNVISHHIDVSMGSEKESLDRPAWTSEQSTGMWEAYRYNHSRSKVVRRKERKR